MNKNALKTFAIWARVQLMEAVKLRAYEYGIDENGYGEEKATVLNGRALSNAEAEQRAELVTQIKRKGFNQVVEEVAYTWFNRFIALRYMEVNGYLPTRIRVFSDESGAFNPEILKQATNVELEGIDKNIIYDFIDKQDNEGLFKYLVIAQCNTLNHNLPGMFEKINNYTELLFPNKLLTDGSVVAHLVNDIDEPDWLDIEIIGWLYQYYITEKHESVIDPLHGKAIQKEDVPAATQLFTTDWVVKYIIDNSLGRYWLERNPSSPLKSKLKYYVQPSDFKTVDERVSPESITFYDPCMGSGHFLVYAFDVLMEIYLECGWNERDAAKSIIENNLYGIDLDERAYQLAYFAVMMKARSYSRRILNQNAKCNLCAIVETNDFNEDYLELFGSLKSAAKRLLNEFVDAKEYGSLISVKTEMTYIKALKEKLEEIENEAYQSLIDYARRAGLVTLFKPVLQQAEILAKKFTVVDTNPPYMNKYDAKLKQFVQDNYADFKGDMFSVFMRRNFDSCCVDGILGFMTPNSWIAVKLYEKLRVYILNNKEIISLIQMAKGAFFKEATVDICAFSIKNSHLGNKGCYFRLEQFKGDMNLQREKVEEALNDKMCGYYYETDTSAFINIPGHPLSYWISQTGISAFYKGNIGQFSDTKQGFKTGNNNRFLRYWFEISVTKIYMGTHKNNKKWFPCNKGGDYRKWYGNKEYVVNWENDGYEIINYRDAQGKQLSRPQNLNYNFREALTWSTLSSGPISFRFSDENMMFESKGSGCFPKKKEISIFSMQGFLNSKVAMYYLSALAPTVDYSEGSILKLPFWHIESQSINEIVQNCILISHKDWDSFETSWDFKKHPLI